MILAELAWQNLRWLPIALTAAVLAAAVALWVYTPQARLRSPAVRWGLPLLRILALSAVALALIKPVVLRAKSLQERGAVLVLIDRSASMNVVDAQRSPARLIALADGLKLLPEGLIREGPRLTSDDVEQLRSQAERITRSVSELEYARLTGRGVEPAQTRLDDALAQFTGQVQSLMTRTGDKTRSRLHERLAALLNGAEARDGWLRELPQKLERLASVASEAENQSAEQTFRASPEVRAAADRLSRLSRVELASLAAMQAFGEAGGLPVAAYSFAGELSPASLSAAPATRPADEHASDPLGAIRAAVGRYPPGGVRAVVLLSDGRIAGGAGNVEALAAAIGSTPVYPVRVAHTTPPRDVSIVRLNAPSRAFVGETVTVRAEVRSVGVRGEWPIKLTAAGATQEKKLRFSEDGLQQAEFTLKPDRPGVIALSAAIAPQAGEVSPANNTLERRLAVLSDKVRVLLIAQSAGRDVQFLRDALARTPWVQLDESIAASSDAAAPLKSAALTSADAVILEDAGPNLLTVEQWKQLRQLVVERGGGAIWLAGDLHSPAELLNQPDAAALLPIAEPSAATWRAWQGEWPTLRATPVRGESRLPEALRLGDDAEASQRRWNELPAMFRLMQLSPLKPGASPLLIDAESKAPVVTESRIGGGRVVFVGMNETWRWRYKVGQRDQDRFWLQLLRHVADEPYAASAASGGRNVSIDADRVSAEPGRPVRFRVRIRDAAGVPATDASVQLLLRSADGVERLEALPAVSPGRFERSLTLPAGQYTASVKDVAEPAIGLGIAATGEAEMSNLAGDDRLLRRLADATGGAVLLPERLADLPQQLIAEHRDRPQLTERRLWDSPWLFAFVLACLGLEWAIRKQVGLA